MRRNVITVIVDRPIGTKHPVYSKMQYPVNYGYVKGVMAPDGEEQDVYILGVSEPIKEFTGEWIAVIHRKNDVEDKWVAAPEGMSIGMEDIRKHTFFQEQYFDSEIEMV